MTGLIGDRSDSVYGIFSVFDQQDQQQSLTIYLFDPVALSR